MGFGMGLCSQSHVFFQSLGLGFGVGWKSLASLGVLHNVPMSGYDLPEWWRLCARVLGYEVGKVVRFLRGTPEDRLPISR